MNIPRFYYDIYKKSSKELLKALLSKCEKCNGQGYKLVDVSGENMFQDCECVINFKKYKVYTNAGINVKHVKHDDEWFKLEFSEETYKRLHIIQRNLSDALSVDFVIYPKTLKTWGASHIGNQIVKYCVDAGINATVAASKNVMDLFFSWDNEELKECLEYLQNVDVLLIDEFGSEYNSKMKENGSFVANNFNSFILERKRTNKTTIIASNFPAIGIHKTYSKEICDVITNNFVGMEVLSNSKKKTEFETLTIKIQKPELSSCFDDLDIVKTPKTKIGR